jgi:diguanylate cyclase (GGDEF)-like protein/PAS domain S-box-containing protein
VLGRSGRWVGLAALAAAFAGFAALLLLQPLPRSVGEPVAWAVQTVTVLAACTAMLRRARAGDGRLRRARLLIAGSLVAGATAGVLAVGWVATTGAPPPDPSVVDAVYFCYLPLVVAGLLSYPVLDTRAGSGTRALLEGVVAASALWFIVYSVLLGPAHVGAALALPTQLATLAYPAADLFVLGLLASLLPRVAPAARRELIIIGGSLGLYAIADLAYSVLAATGTYRADSWVSVLAEAGLLLIVVGARTSDRGQLTVRASSPLLRGLPAVPVVVAIIVALSIAFSGGAISGTQLFSGITLVAGLFLRQLVGSRDQQRLTERLRVREELFRSLVTGASDLITLHDGTGQITYASPAVERVLGLPQREIMGMPLGRILQPDDARRLQQAFDEVLLEPGASAECLVQLRSASGDWRWMQVLLHNRLHDPSVRGVIGNSRDVHERHVLERRLEHAAFHDALTDLGNLAQARASLDRCYAAGRNSAVILVDLDGFKAVNDTFGHAHGDALLRGVAERLRQCLRAEDEVMRLGGDEFIVVVDDAQDAQPLAERLLAALREPMTVAGTTLTVGASLGVASTVDAAVPDELLRNADLAMYAAKAAGRGQVACYLPSMHASATRRMVLTRGLRAALDDDQLRLHYQPIVQLPQGEILGAEALLRWDHPVEGPISPAVFIPVAEESGLIGDIDLWVLERACRDIAQWRAAGLPVPRISINVSRRHMTAELPAVIAGALARHGLTGEALCVEVTESAVVPDPVAAAAALSQVRALGVTVALDDFGSGESSLSQLVRLPVDSVKIDRSFTQHALADLASLRLLTSIVGVCQALSLPIVAEGIEQQELADVLAGIGCDRGQGFHFARPQPAEQFVSLLTAPVPAPRTPVLEAAAPR